MSILVTYKRDQTAWIARLTFQLVIDKICLLLATVCQGTRAYKERIHFEIFVDLRNSGPSRPQNRTF